MTPEELKALGVILTPEELEDLGELLKILHLKVSDLPKDLLLLVSVAEYAERRMREKVSDYFDTIEGQQNHPDN